MSAGGGGFFNCFTPWGGGGGAGAAGAKAMARAGVEITLSADSKDQEEDAEGSPLRTRRSTTSPTTTGSTTAETNTPSVAPTAMLNMKPGGTQFFTQMVPLPQTMMPGDLCPHPAMPGMGNKARVYTRLWICQGLKANRGRQSLQDLLGGGR
jgi:hypothetical protein